MGEDEVHVACPDPYVIPREIGLIHLGWGEIRQAVYGADNGPGEGAVYGVTKNLVAFELSGEYPTCPGAERVDLDDVKGILLWTARRVSE